MNQALWFAGVYRIESNGEEGYQEDEVDPYLTIEILLGVRMGSNRKRMSGREMKIPV